MQIDNNQRKDVFWENVSYSFGNIQLQYVDNVVSEYREITSDIAMYSMMNLSPFEYIKLMTTILPEDDLMNPFSVERIVTVIAVMEDISFKAEDICTRFWEKEVEIVKKLYKFCDNLRKADFREKVKVVLKKIITEIEDVQNVGSYTNISSVMDNIERLKEEVIDEDAEVFSLIAKIAKLLERLLLDNVNYILVLCENETLLNDYRKGASKMRGIITEIDQNSGPSMTKIKDMCNSSRKYISERHYKTGCVNDEQLNAKSIEFLLDLYYKRKIRNSRWTGGLTSENKHKNNS